ncbi:hypothetical protein [Photorhabdus sp. RM71S]|uniref:hypothetical protein n=1 Tax=Photorhabdus sp. RM71S TaxID=3342824 RepID=UPI0036DDC1F9
MSDNNTLFSQVRDSIHFDTLLEQGMEAIDIYAGQIWTDTAEHDPGVTLLQDFCYGTSDLAYRHCLPLKDLLTPKLKDQKEGIFPAAFGPQQALTCGPVTMDDYRRAVLDLHDNGNPGKFYFRNVQLALEDEKDEQYKYWFDASPGKRIFTFSKPKEEANAELTFLILKGNYHIYLELMSDVDQSQAQEALDNFLDKHRNLCERVREVTWVIAQPLNIESTIELEDDCTDYARVLAEIYMTAEAFISPQARRTTAADLLAQGASSDAVYQGPKLQHGWITKLPPPYNYRERISVDISPLASLWLSIDGVKSIQGLQLQGRTAGTWMWSSNVGRYPQLWGDDPFKILSDESSTASVKLVKRGQQCTAAADAIKRYVVTPALIDEDDVVMPYGRYRQPAKYHSLGGRMPPCYGLQEPASLASQIQLHQFMLPFEQVLANGCQQLALLPDLLAFNRTQSTPVWGGQWPFADDDSIVNKVHAQYRDNLNKYLSEYQEDSDKELAIINDLLGYFGSQRSPRTLPIDKEDFLTVQRSYLNQHAVLGYHRASIQIQSVSALQKRIAARLGIGKALFTEKPAMDNLPFYLVEHRALLPALPDPQYEEEQVPMAADNDQQNFQLTVKVEDGHPLHVGLMIDLIIKSDDGVGQDYTLPTVMVKEIKVESTGTLLFCSLQDNAQLNHNVARLVEAHDDKKLRWKNSDIWLQDMWYPLHYDSDTHLNMGEKRIKATLDAPYPVMLQVDDTISLHDIDDKIIHAEVVKTNRINGSFVIKAKGSDILPDSDKNYRWYIDVDSSKPMKDRFSFMISLVFPQTLLNNIDDQVMTENWIKQCISEEIPCHISALIHWLDNTAFTTFGRTYQEWQNNGMPLGDHSYHMPLGDHSYQLLRQLTLGTTLGVLNGIGYMRIATEQQRTDVVGQSGTEWREQVITDNELFFIPKN